MKATLTAQQVVSKERVAAYGEVYTAPREVNAMLDLVKHETERIDARFLEPACGTGNFLVEILARKLAVVAARYARNQQEYERYAVLAVSSLYGIDILEENVNACRDRLFNLFDQRYRSIFKRRTQDACRASVRTLLAHNILWGDALSLTTVDKPARPIVFAEWAFVTATQLKRRDYAFAELIQQSQVAISDEGKPVFFPQFIREYPPIHFLKIADYEPAAPQPRRPDLFSQPEQ
jgi:hypothetical protein